MSESACRDNAAREMTEDWQLAHQELLRLARARAGLDFEEGRWLLRAAREHVTVVLNGDGGEDGGRRQELLRAAGHDLGRRVQPQVACLEHERTHTGVAAQQRPEAGRFDLLAGVGLEVGLGCDRGDAGTVLQGGPQRRRPRPRRRRLLCDPAVGARLRPRPPWRERARFPSHRRCRHP